MVLPRRARRLAARSLGAALAGAVALGGTACRDPEIPPPSAPSEAEDTPSAIPSPGPVASVPDPRLAELQAASAQLLATLRRAHADFTTLAEVADADAARATAEPLPAVLAAAPRWSDLDGDGEPDDLGVAPLLPGPAISREETIDYGDAFTAVLSAARDAGADGSAWVDVLREPIVGDVGSWQRDPEGLLDGIEEQVRRIRDVAAAERAVAELAGEGPRALAWALLARDAAVRGDLERVRAYGERGAVHVDLMLEAVLPLAGGADAPDDGA